MTAGGARRRRASTVDWVTLVLGLSQAAGAGTLAMLELANATSPDLGGGLLYFGLLFALLAVLIAVSSVLAHRQSIGARFALVGAEVLLGVTGAVLLPTIGVLVAATTVVVVVLGTLGHWLIRA